LLGEELRPGSVARTWEENIMNILWWLLPDEAMILVIAGIGLGLILGLIKGRPAMGILGGIVLSLILAPFVESLFGSLPSWISILILAAVGMAIFRGIASLFLGERAAGHMVGVLAADVVRFFFRLLFFPFWILRWVFRRI
jgi:hypothetical protein